MSSAIDPKPTSPLLQGRRRAGEVIALCVAVQLTAAVIDLSLSDGLGLFHDLVFVCLCVGAAFSVRPSGFISVALTPPVLMLGVVLLLAIADPAHVADPRDGVIQATVSGLAGHAMPLLLGYAACLGLLGLRRSAEGAD